MNEETTTIEIDEEALDSVPIFPLPDTVLLPHMLVSLHIFEPRYRKMIEDCVSGHRIMAVAMLDERNQPDIYNRPPLYTTAGLGYLRSSAKLPDGRYNVVLEGVARLDVSMELPPSDLPYRRAEAKLLEDQSYDPGLLRPAIHALRSLCSQSIEELKLSQDVLEGVNTIEDPSHLADMIGASVLADSTDKQAVLEELDILQRIQIISGSIGAMLLAKSDEDPEIDESAMPRWGIIPAKA